MAQVAQMPNINKSHSEMRKRIAGECQPITNQERVNFRYNSAAHS